METTTYTIYLAIIKLIFIKIIKKVKLVHEI